MHLIPSQIKPSPSLAMFEPCDSDRGVPTQGVSQPVPGIVSVKLEDCVKTLELNIIVKEEEEERGIWDEEGVSKDIKKEVEEMALKEELENRDEKEELDANTDPGMSERCVSDGGIPAQGISQPVPEMLSVKLEDCIKTVELNVIVKEEER
ncbi:uncharacterized protein LOC105005699 isoform X5 [Esox lucius]|uniref:uncharacterized protein LOC105005699 isoform X5 n=1 Tax=Esox lucius TaxID=8010 RepID=UPI00097330E6|nr:uncharacterized protein LOC105005699 isoform X5 [Esox lucius]XP_034150430.1 uncharacterized protein LOC105005699 isoform X5 [Esox lucius]